MKKLLTGLFLTASFTFPLGASANLAQQYRDRAQSTWEAAQYTRPDDMVRHHITNNGTIIRHERNGRSERLGVLNETSFIDDVTLGGDYIITETFYTLEGCSIVRYSQQSNLNSTFRITLSSICR